MEEAEAFIQEQDFKEPTEESSEKQFFIIGEQEESLIAEEGGGDEVFTAESNEKSFNEVGEEFEDVYLEFEEEEQEVQEQAYEKPKTRRSEASEERGILFRKSYTVDQKLKIIEYAEVHNNRTAARHYSINESSIRCFRRQKDILLKMNPEKKTNRKAFPHWPQLERDLKEFVEKYPSEHGVKAKLKDIKQQAIAIAKNRGIDNFNGSNSYIFKFMQRHNLPSASPRPRKRKLDPDAEVSRSSKL